MSNEEKKSEGNGVEEVKKVTSFNGRVTADPNGEFPVENGRYHLYVSPGCPYAQRVMIMRTLKGLEDVISMDVTHWYISEDGWLFDETVKGCTVDSINGFKKLKETYMQTNPDYAGRITVPVLYDKVKKVIVNNESAEIMEMLDSEFNEFCATQEQRELSLYRKEHKKTIEELLEWMTPNVITGVYKVRLAKTQEDHDQAVDRLFDSLDKLESILEKRRYLTGDSITEIDVKFFVVLIRFDVAFYTVLRCNLKRIIDYKNLFGYLCDLYQNPAFAVTVNINHIKGLYYLTDRKKAPSETVIPKGPLLDLTVAHGREALAKA